MALALLLGIIGWLVPTIAGVWFLMAFRDLRDDIRTIRRYLQALYNKQEKQ